MSKLSNVVTSAGKKPIRCLIYGVPGVGKSTFGASAPKPLFITPEGGVDEIPGAVQVPGLVTFKDIQDTVKELITTKHDYQTLVLDSADWIEKLVHAQIVGSSGKTIITCNGGYGTGYRDSEQIHAAFLKDLAKLRDEKKMHIIITAHHQVKPVKDPEALHEYDSFDIKCHDFVSALWREWCDCVLFARFKTYTKVNDDERTIAIGEGERVMYTQERPAYKAKNRYNLPLELPVSWAEFYKARMAGGDEESAQSLVDQISGLIPKLAPDIQEKVAKSVIESGKDTERLKAILNRIKDITGGVK